MWQISVLASHDPDIIEFKPFGGMECHDLHGEFLAIRVGQAQECFVPPAGVNRVIVFADKDRPTEQHPKGHGQEAARQLVQRLWEMGIMACAILPAGEIPSGQKSLDWLDILNRDGKTGFPNLRSVEQAIRRVA